MEYLGLEVLTTSYRYSLSDRDIKGTCQEDGDHPNFPHYHLFDYSDLLFRQLAKEPEWTFENLVYIITGLYDAKWYLLGRLRYVVQSSVFARNNSDPRERYMKMLCTKSVEWIKELILDPIRSQMAEGLTVEQVIKKLNATVMFEAPGNRQTELPVGYISGSAEKKLELMQLLSTQRTKYQASQNPYSYEEYTKVINKICELSESLGLENIELALLIMSSFPDCRTWLLTQFEDVGRSFNLTMQELLQGKEIAWAKTILYKHIPLYLSHEELTKSGEQEIFETDFTSMYPCNCMMGV